MEGVSERLLLARPTQSAAPAALHHTPWAARTPAPTPMEGVPERSLSKRSPLPLSLAACTPARAGQKSWDSGHFASHPEAPLQALPSWLGCDSRWSSAAPTPVTAGKAPGMQHRARVGLNAAPDVQDLLAASAAPRSQRGAHSRYACLECNHGTYLSELA